MADFSGGLSSVGGGEAPGQGELSARGARIADGTRGLLDKGFDRYLDDPFDAVQNPQVTATFRTAFGGLQDLCPGIFAPHRISFGLGEEETKVVFEDG